MSKQFKFTLFAVLGVVVIVVLAWMVAWLTKPDSDVVNENGDSQNQNTSPIDSSSSGDTANVPQSESNIKVTGLVAGQNVSLPIMVSGEARVFENVVSFRLKDKDGSILYQGFTSALSPDMGLFGPFTKEINYLFKKPTSPEVTLEVYWGSPRDGSDLDVVSVPLKLDLNNLTSVKIFLGNSKLDPENSCNKVFSIERIVAKTQTPARTALDILLEGASLDSNYFTSINQGVKINKLTIVGGVAKVDFDETLQAGVGGSCKVGAIRAQITETLKQFPTVNSVIVSINGRTEDILQP